MEAAALERIQCYIASATHVAFQSTLPKRCELTRFKALPQLDEDVDPLAWMLKDGSLFPSIQCVARDVLCVPASSASVERLFSRSGLTCTDLRNRLEPKLVEKMMWLVGNE